MMYVFDTCEAFIRTIPALVYDDHRPEDLNTDGEDHVADEVRYLCMLNPITPRRTVREIPPGFDPLNIWSDTHRPEKYAFYKI